jgi:endoglucanase
MHDSQYAFLTQLLSRPTAPFREYHVKDFVLHYLESLNIPFFEDALGNIVVGVRSPAQYQSLLKRRTREPVRIFIAHMDHPGFHGTRWLDDSTLQIKWHGGSPTRYLARQVVWLATSEGPLGQGRLGKVGIAAHGYSIDTAEVKVSADSMPAKRPAAKKVFGAFDFRAPVWRSGHRLYTRVADDLVGVFAIVETARKVFGRGKRGNPGFIGLLTRAEEVGFVGAVGHLDLGWLSAATRMPLCVSLEASRTLPRAEIGKGPVVRLGDRRTVYDADALQVLTTLAQKTLPGKHQRRIMDGGACEASATTAYGLPTIAMSIPLGNYHNQGLEGGQDCPRLNGPAPEFVHMDDIEGMLKLCAALMKPGLDWASPWTKTRQGLQKNFRRYQSLL